MKKIDKSIDQFCERLYKKGYDGIYVLNGGRPGKLPDLLRSHIHKAAANPMNNSFPARLRTIVSLPTKTERYLTSEFEIQFDVVNGVQIIRMSSHVINCLTNTAVYSKDMQVKVNDSLPKAEKVHSKLKHKLIRKKGIKH